MLRSLVLFALSLSLHSISYADTSIRRQLGQIRFDSYEGVSSPVWYSPRSSFVQYRTFDENTQAKFEKEELDKLTPLLEKAEISPAFIKIFFYKHMQTLSSDGKRYRAYKYGEIHNNIKILIQTIELYIKLNASNSRDNVSLTKILETYQEVLKILRESDSESYTGLHTDYYSPEPRVIVGQSWDQSSRTMNSKLFIRIAEALLQAHSPRKLRIALAKASDLSKEKLVTRHVMRERESGIFAPRNTDEYNAELSARAEQRLGFLNQVLCESIFKGDK